MPPTTFDSQKKDKWLHFIQQLSPATDPRKIRLMGQLRMVSHALYQVSEESLDAANLSYAQFRLLMGLYYGEQMEHCPAQTPSEISRSQGTSPNTISALIRQLEENGLVARALDPLDRRKFNIGITEAGRSVVQTHAQSHLGSLDAAMAALDAAEIETLSRLLDKLSQAIIQE